VANCMSTITEWLETDMNKFQSELSALETKLCACKAECSGNKIKWPL
jgi:hypothetical protein